MADDYELRPGGASYNFAPINTGYIRIKSLGAGNFTGVAPIDTNDDPIPYPEMVDGALEYDEVKDGGLIELGKFKKDIIVEGFIVEAGIVVDTKKIIHPAGGIPEDFPATPFRIPAGADLKFTTSTNAAGKRVLIALREAPKHGEL